MPSFNYVAYGLTVASDIELPELIPFSAEAPEVTVKLGSVPAELAEPTARGVTYQATPDLFLIQVRDIGRFLISHGREIIVEPASAGAADAVRLFLLGPAFAALLNQRGCLPLHGSAIETAGGAVAFVGPSGRGKSTVAAAFARRGYRALADDICALQSGADGRLLLQPAFPQIKLWADTVERIGVDAATLDRVRPELKKYSLPLADDFSASPQPLRAIYVLTVANDPGFSLAPLTGLNKIHALARNTFGYKYVRGIGRQARQFTQAAGARELRVCRVARPAQPFVLEPLLELLENDWT